MHIITRTCPGVSSCCLASVSSSSILCPTGARGSGIARTCPRLSVRRTGRCLLCGISGMAEGRGDFQDGQNFFREFIVRFLAEHPATLSPGLLSFKGLSRPASPETRGEVRRRRRLPLAWKALNRFAESAELVRRLKLRSRGEVLHGFRSLHLRGSFGVFDAQSSFVKT